MTMEYVIHRFESLPSTNDAARDLAREGAAHGTVVLAEEQTHGRGTKGRVWHSPPGLGLYVSFILRPDDWPEVLSSFPLLPLAVGLAGSEAASVSAGDRVRLKWPNDLVSGKRKLGGILIESASRGRVPEFAIAGVGINVNHEESDFPEDLRGSATSLRLVSGQTVDKERLFGRLCRSLESWYNSLGRGGSASVIRGYEDRMAFSPGDRIRLGTLRGGFLGVYRGLTPGGSLLIEGEGRTSSISFEEIQSLDWD